MSGNEVPQKLTKEYNDMLYSMKEQIDGKIREEMMVLATGQGALLMSSADATAKCLELKEKYTRDGIAQIMKVLKDKYPHEFSQPKSSIDGIDFTPNKRRRTTVETTEKVWPVEGTRASNTQAGEKHGILYEVRAVGGTRASNTQAGEKHGVQVKIGRSGAREIQIHMRRKAQDFV